MNKAELINAVAASADVSKKDTEAVITAMLDTITDALKEGDKVPVVLDGGKVAGGHDGGPLPEDGIRIKKGKLRGWSPMG